MTIEEIAVTLGGLVLMAFLAWYFFGPKKARRAQVRGGIQEVEVTVKGGYSPDDSYQQQGLAGLMAHQHGGARRRHL